MICIDSAYFIDVNEMILGHIVGLEFGKHSFSNLPHMPKTGNTCHYLSRITCILKAWLLIETTYKYPQDDLAACLWSIGVYSFNDSGVFHHKEVLLCQKTPWLLELFRSVLHYLPPTSRAYPNSLIFS